jgi:LPPG:FO 2-phospho-L-lactate transferase
VRVVLLAGGGGGARFARGLADALPAGDLTVVGNVGDDVEILGLHVSPDLDSLLYTLAGLIDDERGWGRAGETWSALEAAGEWGGEDWFRLGDLDLGIHLVRTQRLREGALLSEVTAELTARRVLATSILPATDDRLRTWVETPAGTFPFQEWYVGRGHRDEVTGVSYEGASDAGPAPGVLAALAEAEAILFAPSNPYLSLGPILAVQAIRSTIAARRSSPGVRCVAVSPLVGGRSVTGPLDRMLRRMAGGTTPEHVARSYEGLIDALVIDEADAPAEASVALVAAKTLMRDRASERRLAETVLGVACG